MRSAVPKPHSPAIVSAASAVCSSRQRAGFDPRLLDELAGVTPVSERKWRAKLRGLIASRSASVATSSRSAGWARIQVCSSRISRLVRASA